jgi:hypothetical protein
VAAWPGLGLVAIREGPVLLVPDHCGIGSAGWTTGGATSKAPDLTSRSSGRSPGFGEVVESGRLSLVWAASAVWPPDREPIASCRWISAMDSVGGRRLQRRRLPRRRPVRPDPTRRGGGQLRHQQGRPERPDQHPGRRAGRHSSAGERRVSGPDRHLARCRNYGRPPGGGRRRLRPLGGHPGRRRPHRPAAPRRAAPALVTQSMLR